VVRTGQVLIEVAPDLVDVFVPGTKIIALVGKAVAQKVGWTEELEKLIDRRQQGGTATQPAITQSRIFEQYTDFLVALAEEQPLIVVIDDLQWADASSISLLFHIGRRIEHARILLVGAYRPADVELGHPSIGPGQVGRHPLESVVNEFQRYYGDVEIELDDATEDEARQFVDALVDSEPNRLDANFRRRLYQHTAGHPLFTSELLAAMKERGDLTQDPAGNWIEGGTVVWDQLPARVEGVVEERVDRLDDELHETLSIASVEGVKFTAEVVAEVQGIAIRHLVRRLDRELEREHRLVRAQGIRQVGNNRLSHYRFRHKLFQEYLYATLHTGERAYLHEDIGKILENLYQEDQEELATIAPQLARHFEAAGMIDKALSYLHLAGQRAARLSANAVAVDHLRHALGLLKDQPPSRERDELELSLRIAMGTPLMAIQGLGAAEVQETYQRAYELCQQVGQTPQLFPALWGLWVFYFARAEWPRALELGEQFHSLAVEADDPDLLLEARRGLGTTLLHVGDFGSSREYLKQALAMYDPVEHHAHAFIYANDPGIVCSAVLTHVLWALGYPDQAVDRLQYALNLAHEINHPLSLALALAHGASLYYYRRDPEAALELAEEGITLSAEHHFVFWQALAMTIHGRALIDLGRPEAGIAEMREGMATWRATGAKMEWPGLCGIMGEAHGQLGEIEAGLRSLNEALTTLHETGELWWQAEAYRVQGELLLLQGDARDGVGNGVDHEERAAACFQEAYAIARQQNAKSWELRATISLARLAMRHGDAEEARARLAETYAWFTEGLDTPDLVAARLLLDSLG
jgi:predicted ATPase